MQRSAQAAPERLGLWRLAPPKSLGLLLVIVAILGLAWALIVPPFQSPDELDHFAYAQSLGETLTIPGAAGRQEDSSDEAFANGAVGASRTAFYPSTSPPDWSRSDYRAYLSIERGAHPPTRTNGGGPSGADQNPPLYYLIADIGYLIDHGGTAFGRLYAMQLLGVVLLMVTTAGAWLLAGETLGRRRLPQLACAAAAGVLPMNTFISTSVNPDALLITLWTLALWLGARVINRRAQGWDALALCAVTAAAILTKATSYALVAPVLLALVIGWLRRPAAQRRAMLPRLGAAGLVLVLPVIGWLELAAHLGRAGINQIGASAAHPFSVTQFVNYVWQFYLPRIPGTSPFRTTPQLAVYDIWLRQLTGIFGWLDVYLPSWMYPVAACAVAGLAAAAVYALVRLVRRRHLALLAFFALTLIALLGLLHISGYLLYINGGGQFLQGRYLLPVIGLFGLAIAVIVRVLPQRGQTLACGVSLTVLLAAQAVALATIVQAYYL